MNQRASTILVVLLLVAGLSGCDQFKASRFTPPTEDKSKPVTAAPAEPTPPRSEIRLIIHPANDRVLFVTNAPPLRTALTDAVTPVLDAADAKLFVVDLRSQEWREIRIAGELKGRFGASAEHATITLELGGPARPTGPGRP
jgi:hypothetical protein